MEILSYISQWLNPNNIEFTIRITDSIVFLLFAIPVGYLFIFAFKSVGKTRFEYEPAAKKYRFLILFPSYQEDAVIVNSVKSFFKQHYPRDRYDILVIAEEMEEETIEELKKLSATVVPIEMDISSKTAAYQAAIEYIDYRNKRYDVVVSLDADNEVNSDYLDRLNDAFYSGCSVVQTHRVAKNYDTNMSVLDAVSEEMNNSIFRKGHTRLGFSSALIGSGMAFEYDLFKECISDASTIGIDKQMEIILLKDNVFIEYLETVYTYDEKVKKKKQFYNQRRRWIANQFYNLFFGLRSLPSSIISGNWDYANKIFQWMMPPRVILLGMIILIACGLTIFDLSLATKWWILLCVLIVTFAMAIPDYLVNKKLVKALVSLPAIFFLMFINLFRIPGAKNKLIHTKHTENTKSAPNENRF